MYRFARTSPQDPRAVGLTGALGLQLSDNSVLGKSTLFDNPPQLIDPSLRGGDALFPNLRVGNFGREALAEDLTPYRVAKMFRPDVINMNASNPRLAKASNDIQFQKAGQSPGQAKALGELIRQDPILGNSFNVGYGSTLNREQGLAQKQGRVYEFDPTDEMWKSGFKRKNPSIVAMDDLQDALRTLPSGSQLTTYDGRPLDPSFTKAYYNLDATQDINDPQLFFNLKGKSDVDYGRIAQALGSIPLDKTKKADYSLAKRWERVQNYSPYPPSGATYVLNADKPYQSIDEIMAEVNQIEPWRTPRMADSRIARSQNSGNSDLNIIPKDYTRKEYLEATGDSDNLPPLDYAENKTVAKVFGNTLVDKSGYSLPKYQFTHEDNLIGREIGEGSIRTAYEPSDDRLRLAKLARSGDLTVEDRTFLLNPPEISPINYYDKTGQITTQNRASTRLGTQRTEPYANPYRQAFPQGEVELPNGMVVNQYDPIKAPELVGSIKGKGGESYYRIAGQNYMVGDKEGLAKPFYTPEVILPESLARKTPMYFEGTGGISPNNYRVAGSTSAVGGYNEFDEVMDEGIQVSRALDSLYKENDELADLASLPFFVPQGEAIAYQQSDVLDRIVDAERAAERMGGVQRRLSGKNDQGSFEQERMAYEGRPSALTQYNVNEVLEPSFGSDYSGRTNTGRIRTAVGTNYDAGIPVGAVVKTRLANQVIEPIQLDNPEIAQFNQAQYTRDMIDRGGVLIDTQLGVPILKAPTTSFNPATQRNESYLQPVRPSRVANGVANWQAPESLAVGRVGRQTPIIGIPELPTDTGMTVERRASSPMASIQRELMSDNSVSLSPWSKAPLPSRNWTTTVQGQILYPNAGIGPINTGLKPKPTIGELFGFTAITPEGLAKYRDMG